jgi:hypothetical protein
MFGKLGEAFSSAVDKAKSTFSFSKSPEAAKAVALSPEVDARPAIHDSVARVMDEDVALDNWAKGKGWNAEQVATPAVAAQAVSSGRLNRAFDFSASNAPDLSAFRRVDAGVKDETPGQFGDWVAETQDAMRVASPKNSGRLDNVVLEMPQTQAQKFAVVPKAGNGGWFGENSWANAQQAKFTEPVDSPRSVFAAFGDAARMDETPLTEVFLDEVRNAAWVKPVQHSWAEAANDDFDYAGTNVVPFRPRETHSAREESPWAFRGRIAAAVAVLMATVGGIQAASHASQHNKPTRSYSVDDIVPLNNEQAAALEAQKRAGQYQADNAIKQNGRFTEIAQR